MEADGRRVRFSLDRIAFLWRGAFSKSVLPVLILALLSPSCGDEAGNLGSTPEGTIVVSSTLPQGDLYPGSAVIDSLLHRSNSELSASSCYAGPGDPDYPEVIYIANDIVRTFAFVWLPDGWDGFPSEEKRVVIHLHGHCGIGAKRFCEWYELASEKDIGVISLQYWMGEVDWGGGNEKPNDDYAYYQTGPGQTCGWHLNIEKDIYPFVEALAEHYDAHAVMLHGFSMAAATAVIVDYRDMQSEDKIRFVVFNAGHMAPSHYFREEIESSGEDNAFSGEPYFFFLEDIGDGTFQQQADTREFVVENGATDIQTVIAQDSGYRHGALLNNEDFRPVRERIIALFDSLTTVVGGS